MARREMIASDLTGADLTGHENISRKITVDGKSYTVDLADSEVAALVAFASGNGSDALAKLLAKSESASTTARRSGSRSGASQPGTGPNAQARIWAREIPAGQAWAKAHPHVPIGEPGSRGRANQELVAAYQASVSSAASLAAGKPGNLAALASTDKSDAASTA